MLWVRYLFKIIVILGVLAFVATLELPAHDEQGGVLPPSSAIAALPDADLRAVAEQYEKEGRLDEALVVLDYIVDNNMPDRAASEQMRSNILERIEKNNSAMGRLYKVGYGFVTGKADDWESISGATAGDFLVYGDIRDIVRELVFEDKADLVVVGLSAIGLATTVCPVADYAASVAKLVKKSDGFSAPMLEMIKKIATSFQTLTPAMKKLEIEKVFVPIWELYKRSTSWPQFISMMRSCTNVSQIKLLATISASSKTNSKRLGQILAVSGSGSAGTSGKVIEFLSRYNEKGLENIYAVLRKGPKGITTLLKNPWLKGAAKPVKFKQFELLTFANRVWDYLSQKYALGMAAFKYTATTALVFWLVSSLIGFLSLAKPLFPRGREKERAEPFMSRKAVVAGVCVLIVLIPSMLTVMYYLNTFSVPDATARMYGTFVSGSARENPVHWGFIISGLIILLFAYIYCFMYSRGRISSIMNSEYSQKEKRSLVENCDIYFDLQLYIGLAATILAFIGIALGELDSARTAAYGATLLGIVFSVAMRLVILQPAKDKLARETSLKYPSDPEA